MTRGGIRLAVAAGVIAAASFVIQADGSSHSQATEIQLQLGRELLSEGRYLDALDAFKRALAAAGPDDLRTARGGLIQTALRVADFDLARSEAEKLVAGTPHSADAIALHGDTLWAAGLFQEAEGRYQEALALAPDLARGHHGVARALAAQNRLDEAIEEVQTALRLAPRDLEVYHTLGSIYEQMHRFEEAAAAYTNYINLLPNKDQSEQADWARARVRFLRSFGQRVPYQTEASADGQVHTIDFRLVNDKVIVRARVNDGPLQDFVVDTGSENTVLTRPTAQRAGVTPITYTLSAGVGEVGLRGLQLARINKLEVGGLKLRNVPCVIKDPPLRDLPKQESESLSPLAFGYSMVIDYRARKIVFGRHLPQEPSDVELPLRVHRLATVRGTVDGAHAANFVVDTGGEVISISKSTAAAIGKEEPARRIALKVWGSSGWDRDAFLLTGIDLKFSDIRYDNFSVVVLNLNTPSALLGFQVGGIVGHKFLSRYRVAMDLERSVLGLTKM
ncbi:MAG: aspartyl protease family protein [Vicinamibacterales bacterium]